MSIQRCFNNIIIVLNKVRKLNSGLRSCVLQTGEKKLIICIFYGFSLTEYDFLIM